MTWSRDTPWRQGHVLPPEVVTAVGLASEGDEACVVVVSHDCDLAQAPSVEADVEVLVGRWIPEANGNFAHAKNARCLHLSLTGGEQGNVAELRSNGKRSIPKDMLDGHGPSSSILLKASERVTLQRWLASRYRRSTFADEFDRRLDDLGLRDGMSRTLKRHGNFITAVYFDVDRGEQVVRSTPDNPYQLSVYLLYDTSHSPEQAEQAAVEAARSILETFRKKCCSAAGIWSGIELLECEAISDQVMTVQQADAFARWSADHISLRTDPPAIMRQDD